MIKILWRFRWYVLDVDDGSRSSEHMSGLIKGINRLSETVNAVTSVIGAVGWFFAGLPVVLALGTGAAGWVERLPYAVIWTCCFTVLAMSAVVIKTFARAKTPVEGIQRPPPSDDWRYVDTFYLSQAACLFAGIEPLEGAFVPQGSAVPWLTMLIDAVASGEIDRIVDDQQDQFNMVNGTYRPSVATRVSRNELRKFSAKRNRNPRFLDPPP